MVPTPMLRAIRRELASGQPAPWVQQALASPSFQMKLRREGVNIAASSLGGETSVLMRARIASVRAEIAAQRLRARIAKSKIRN
jgi:hypothetical protein